MQLPIGRARTIQAVLAGVICLSGIALFAQREARRDPRAPTDKSASWTADEMRTVNQEMAAAKEITHRFFGEKGFNMEVRRLAGPQPILQHGKKSDFMVIQDGEGTFMSGGALLKPRTRGEDRCRPLAERR